MSDPMAAFCGSVLNGLVEKEVHTDQSVKWAQAAALHRIAAALERLADQGTQTPGAEPREGGESP